MPSWVPFSHVSPPNRPAQNFIGPFGAIIAGFSYMMIGAASYLLAVVLLGFGGAKLFNAKLRVTPRVVWIVLFLVSGACLLQLQTQHLQGWRAAFNIQGPGGWVGYSLGKKLLLTWMGGVGSIILLSGVYVSSLILMTGLRPIHIVRQTVAGVRSGMTALQRMATETAPAEIGPERAIGNQPARAGETAAGDREAVEENRARRCRNRLESLLRRKNWPTGRNRKWSIPRRCRMSRRARSRRWPNSGARRRKQKRAAGLTSQTWDAEHYTLPGFDLLDAHDTEGRTAADPAELEQIQQILIETLGQFGIAVAAGDITKGPDDHALRSLSRPKGCGWTRIVALERDLARATSAERINILAPIPGKDTVGIELANTRK